MRTIIRLRSDRRGVSNIIVVILSLVIMVVIISNVVLWNYQMNQLDWDKTREKIEITEVNFIHPRSIKLGFENNGPLTVHIVSLWISNSTWHQHEDADLFMNAGETVTETITYDWKNNEK